MGGHQERSLAAPHGALFEAFITIDGNMRYQQNLNPLQIGLVVLVAPDNTIETLQPLAPQILQALATLQAGQVIIVPA